MTRVLVIGASGFIGLHVVDHLIERGFAVRATYRRSTPTMFLRKRHVELVPGSLEEPDALRAAMRGCDVVLLTGAPYPRYSLDYETVREAGVTGVQNVCRAARAAGVGRLIYTSTIATLATRDAHVANEDDVPIAMPACSVYRAVKWEMERVVEDAAASGLSAVTLLPGGCIGSGDYRLGTGGLLVSAVRGELPFWFDGSVNLVDIEDVARAHVAAIEAPGSRYCIAPHYRDFGVLLEWLVARYGGALPRKISVREARLQATVAERSAEPRKARVSFPREFVDIIDAGGPVSCARAERDLGLEFAPLEPAFDRACAFFKRVGYLPRTAPQEKTPS